LLSSSRTFTKIPFSEELDVDGEEEEDLEELDSEELLFEEEDSDDEGVEELLDFDD